MHAMDQSEAAVHAIDQSEANTGMHPIDQSEAAVHPIDQSDELCSQYTSRPIRNNYVSNRPIRGT